MKSAFSTKLMLSVCALVGGVFLSSASAKPFKLFSHHDHDHDDDEEAAAPKVYIVTDQPLQPGTTGIVRVVPAPDATVAPAPGVKIAPASQPKSRKSKTGETQYLVEQPTEVPVDRRTGQPLVVRKAEAVEETRERVTSREEKEAPVRTSRSISQQASAQTTTRKVQQQERADDVEARPQVTVTRQREREDAAPAKPKRQVVDESSSPKRKVVEDSPSPSVHEVEESTSTSVARSNNPLMPTPTATEERKPLVPSEIPAPRQETTVTKEVTTSNTSRSIQEAPPEQPSVQPSGQPIEKRVSSTPTPEVPNLTAPSDYASTSRSNSEIAPANLPPDSMDKDKAGAKRSIPVAEKTEKPGFVKTPFTPSKLIDVRGMASGSLAKDPSTSQVFRVP